MAIRPKSIVPIIGEPDIDESYIRQQDVALLKTLLIDRTMTALNDGVRCRVMDWEVGKPVLFMPPFEFKPIETNSGIRGGRNDIE